MGSMTVKCNCSCRLFAPKNLIYLISTQVTPQPNPWMDPTQVQLCLPASVAYHRHVHSSVYFEPRRTRTGAASREQAKRVGDSVAEWLACWTQAQKDLGSDRSRDAVA